MKGSTNSLVSSGDGNVLKTEYIIQPEIASQNITPEYSEYVGPFEKDGVSYDGLADVKLRKIGAWIDSQISADNIRTGHSILGVAGNVIELHGEEKEVKSTNSEQVILPSNDKNGITKVTVKPVVYQERVVNPLLNKQVITPSSGNDALSKVTVNPIDIEYLKEQEPDLKSEYIKKGIEIFDVMGTYQPEFVKEEKTVNPTTDIQVLTPSASADGFGRVTVNAVTSTIDSDIKAENIKKDVNILGVRGTYEGRQPIITTINDSSTVIPTTSEQMFDVPPGNDGFSSFKVSPVTSSIDANIKASNIKRNVEILGVMGTYTTENLQEKVVNPTKHQQVVTFDDDQYEGLRSVTVTGVTAAIDDKILPENIKKDVEILGVTGTLEEGRDPIIQDTITVDPIVSAQVIKPSEGFDGLGQVNINGVTAAIDANILAENIKKGIEILGIVGSLEAVSGNYEENVEVEPSVAEQNITASEGYDALLNVIVKAVTASIDPNILPKNIRQGVQILGVMGSLIEGEEQKYFDWKDLYAYANNSGKTQGSSGEKKLSNVNLLDTDYQFNDMKISNALPIREISAVLFNIVVGYDNLNAIDPVLEQTFIYFVNGKYYNDKFLLTNIPNQISYIYPVTNDYNINGCLLNSEDVVEEKEYNLYVLINSQSNTNKPVLVDGTIDSSMYPIGKLPNVDIIGSPTISEEYVVQGFSNDNYLKTKNIDFTNADTWEIVTRVKCGALGKYQFWCHNFMAVGFDSSNRLHVWNAPVEAYSSMTFTTGVWYTFKIIYNGTQVIASYKTDDGDWTQLFAVNSAKKTTNSYIVIGRNLNVSGEYWSGQIDLENYYIKVNDEIVWEGIVDGALYDTNRYVGKITIPAHNRFEPKNTETGIQWILRDRKGIEFIATNHVDMPLTVDVSAYDKDWGEPDESVDVTVENYNAIGTPSITAEYIASNFTTTINYIKSKNTYDFSGNWGILFKAKFTSLSGYQHFLKIGDSQADMNLLVGMYESYPSFWISSNGTSWNIANNSYSSNISSNTEYYFNIWFNGSTYAIDTSTDGMSWTRRVTINNSTKIFRKNTNVIMGSAWTDSPSRYLNLDLKEVLITCDDKYRFVENKSISSHDIIPLTRNLLFYDRNQKLTDEYGKFGNLLNYIDMGDEVVMPLYRATQAPYYDYQLFTRPNLSANGTIGGSSFAIEASDYYSNYYPYYAFDGNTSNYYHSNSSSTHWIKWYNPNKLKIKSLTIRNGDYSPYVIKTYTLYGSNDNDIWNLLTLGTNTNRNNWSNWDINVDSDEEYMYFRLDFQSYDSSGYTYISEIQINGQENALMPEQGVYIFSPDETLGGDTNYSNISFVDNVLIPEHTPYKWNNESKRFDIKKVITINIEDEDARLYTEYEEAN